MLIEKSSEGDLEKIKQVFAYISQESISLKEIGRNSNELEKILNIIMSFIRTWGFTRIKTNICIRQPRKHQRRRNGSQQQ